MYARVCKRVHVLARVCKSVHVVRVGTSGGQRDPQDPLPAGESHPGSCSARNSGTRGLVAVPLSPASPGTELGVCSQTSTVRLGGAVAGAGLRRVGSGSAR